MKFVIVICLRPCYGCFSHSAGVWMNMGISWLWTIFDQRCGHGGGASHLTIIEVVDVSSADQKDLIECRTNGANLLKWYFDRDDLRSSHKHRHLSMFALIFYLVCQVSCRQHRDDCGDWLTMVLRWCCARSPWRCMDEWVYVLKEMMCNVQQQQSECGQWAVIGILWISSDSH